MVCKQLVSAETCTGPDTETRYQTVPAFSLICYDGGLKINLRIETGTTPGTTPGTTATKTGPTGISKGGTAVHKTVKKGEIKLGVHIDAHSVVHPEAQIGVNCSIGPFCTVAADTVIGDNTSLRSHVVVESHTSIGADCEVYPFVTLGVQSQDLKHKKGTIAFTEIGDRNIIREFVSIHSGTEEGSKTVIGNDCALLAQAHVAHNCIVGNHVTLSHSATLGGHVIIGDYANLGGLCAIHQFCHIGRVGMVGGQGRIIQDVLPFTIADGFPAHMRVVNKIGMERAGYSEKEITEVRKVFRILFMRELRLEEAVKEVEEEFRNCPHIELMLEGIRSSQRGLARPESATFEINVG